MSTDNHTLYVCGGLVQPDQFIDLLRQYQTDLTRRDRKFKDLKFRHNIEFGSDGEGTKGYLWVSEEEVFNELARKEMTLEEFRNKYMNYYFEVAQLQVRDQLIQIIDEEEPGNSYTMDDYINIIADYVQNYGKWEDVQNQVIEKFNEITKRDHIANRFNPSFVYPYKTEQIEEHEIAFLDPTQYFTVGPGEEAGRTVQKYGRCGADLTVPGTYTGYIETSAAKFDVKRGKSYSMTLFKVPQRLTEQMIGEKLSQFGEIESVRRSRDDIIVKFVNPVVHLAVKSLFNKVLPFDGFNISFKVNTY